MSHPHVGVIINPRSGRRSRMAGEGDRRRAFLEHACAAAGIDADIRMTAAAGEATTLARAFADEGHSLVIVLGGDGTVNEVAAGLVGTPTALGIVPAGSGDGLARGLGVPAAWPDAFGVALHGRTRSIDVGYVGDRLFLNVAGVGFDAEVAHAFAQDHTRGFWGYVRQVVRLARVYQPVDIRIDLDGRDYSGRWFMAVFANAPEYGNGAVAAPDADPGDGWLDVVLIEAGSLAGQVWRSRRLFWRRRAPAAGVHRMRARAATIDAARLRAHLDGEPIDADGRSHIRLRPAALQVRVRPDAAE